MLVGFGISLLMYATPIIYPMSIAADKSYGWVLRLNPLSGVFESWRYSVTGIGQMDWTGLLYCLGCLVVTMFIGLLMFLINPIMGTINTWISNLLKSMGASSKILLGAVLGGMMSVDMGGPINKAAYVFGVGSLAAASNDNPTGFMVMAAVMVGGMVPPIVIALSTTFFPKKWTKEERNNGFVNYIMGLCFISEGAIPYAAGDPVRVIPSCIVGSAVSGALSMAFGCTLRAPHGGVFVFPTVGKPLAYIAALLIGSVVGALLLSLLKKNKR
jgi:PTS system fructose-specific IIC component